MNQAKERKLGGRIKRCPSYGARHCRANVHLVPGSACLDRSWGTYHEKFFFKPRDGCNLSSSSLKLLIFLLENEYFCTDNQLKGAGKIPLFVHPSEHPCSFEFGMYLPLSSYAHWIVQEPSISVARNMPIFRKINRVEKARQSIELISHLLGHFKHIWLQENLWIREWNAFMEIPRILVHFNLKLKWRKWSPQIHSFELSIKEEEMEDGRSYFSPKRAWSRTNIGQFDSIDVFKNIVFISFYGVFLVKFSCERNRITHIQAHPFSTLLS